MNNVKIVRDILAENFMFRPIKEVEQIIDVVFKGCESERSPVLMRDDVLQVLGVDKYNKYYRSVPSIVRILQTAYYQEVATELQKTKLN